MSLTKKDWVLPRIKLGSYTSPKDHNYNESEWNLNANEIGSPEPGGVINDTMPVWKTPFISKTCLSKETRAELNIPLDECSGRYLGADRYTQPLLYRKLTPDGLVHRDLAEANTLLSVSEDGRTNVGRELWKTPQGLWIPACTRGCVRRQHIWVQWPESVKLHGATAYGYIKTTFDELDGQDHVCVHGNVFTHRCTDVCEECRKPHRSRPEKKTWCACCEAKHGPGDIDTPQHLPVFYEKFCRTPLERIEEYGFKGTKARLESELRELGLQEPSIKVPPVVIGRVRAAKHDETSQVWENVRRVKPDEGNLPQRISSENPRQFYDVGMTLIGPKQLVRTVPSWVQREFIEKFLKWLYPRDTQLSKRKFSLRLIEMYWVELKEAEEIQSELNLTPDGFLKRLQRLKEKALEYQQCSNR